MKKNKIAVQIFGHLRSYEKVFPYLDAHILQPNDCDVFIHTWTEEEHRDICWHKKYVSNQHVEIKQTDLGKIKKLYSPKMIEIEDNSKIDYPGFFNDSTNMPLRGIKAMSYAQIRVNKLRREYSKKNGIEYDFVLMIRPDVMPLAKLDFSKYLVEFSFSNSSSIHFTSGAHQHTASNKKFDTPLASDLFFFAKPSILDHFFDLKENNFEYFYIDFPRVNMGGIRAPEACFIEALYQSGAYPRFYEFPYAVIRVAGSNHIKANLSSLPDFSRELFPPSELNNSEQEDKKSLFYLLLSRFSNKRIEKIQKQIMRMKRQLDTIGDKLQAIRDNR
ncbi:hypothetical protein NMT31_002447 [Vibrio cholerae]|nr:hypothetical protein [Vibrio cholerae]EJL6967014.1 hypothetical protein [Vibrio cholerae]EKG0034629.1 hypothetical protein [Vibrio cholerae]